MKDAFPVIYCSEIEGSKIPLVTNLLGSYELLGLALDVDARKMGKALIVQANNPLIQAADTKLVYQALKSPNLELTVVMDYYMTPTAELADYVLPAANTLERSDFPAGSKALEPLYERRDDYQFWRELGIRLG